MPSSEEPAADRPGRSTAKIIGRRDFAVMAAGLAAATGLAACTSDSGGSEPSSSSASPEPAEPAAELTMASVGLPERPDGPLRVIIDTDAANEIDDQFALAWALLLPDELQIEAITAAPFSYGEFLQNALEAIEARGDGPRTPFENIATDLGPEGAADLAASGTPADGMEASKAEIERFVELAAPADPPPVFAGATSYLPSTTEPVDSPAAQAIIEAAHASDEPLYVLVLGAPTNVASALLLDPSIAEKVVVVFVAGYPAASTQIDESFNLLQDLAASQVIFEQASHLVYIPGYGVAETLSLSYAESEKYLAGVSPMADSLHELMSSRLAGEGSETPGSRWVMWDMAPIAWLLDPDAYVLSGPATRGEPTAEHTWQPIDGVMVESYRVDDQAVMRDFFGRF